MKAILVPTDFSRTANAAVDVAVSIASKFDGKVNLLHVIEGARGDSFNVEGQIGGINWENKLFEMKLIETSRTKLYKVVDQLKAKGISVNPILRLGDPYHGIQTVIDEQGADLIVMGTTGSSGFRELAIGSNTERVVRRSHCPVLAVPSQQKNNDFKTIVYPTMLRDEEESVIDVLKNTQQKFGSEVHIVRINTPMLFEPDYRVMKRMAEFAKKMKLKNFTLNTFNDLTEETGIGRFAETVNANLIVMGTHTRTGLGHLLSSSIAEDVVNHTRIPVLTYHFKLSSHKTSALPAGYSM